MITKPLPTFESRTFWEQLQKHPIQVPIIQRDYAQGRSGQEELRNSFLQKLHDAINGETTELDFIYGDISGSYFYPLDGQQRLTTLFLLHWYAVQFSQGDHLADKTSLSHFSYETRVSSREFCLALAGDTHLYPQNDPEFSISEVIKDRPWFFSSWEKDPSIRGMLKMLDAIHSKFHDIAADLWKSLTGPGRPITFSVVTLNDLGLSEDLYIKMNARGRPLTIFENFKALLEKRINHEDWDMGRSQNDSFSHLIDRQWTDAFWSINADRTEATDRVDKPLICLVRHSLMLSVARSTESVEAREKVIGHILANNSATYLSELFTEDRYNALYRDLEIITKDATTHGHFQDLNFPIWAGSGDQHSFLQSVLHSEDSKAPKRLTPQYQRRLFLLAQMLFSENSMFNEDPYQEWMRVIRNIIQNAYLEDAASFIGAVRLIHQLSVGSQQIYQFLSTTKVDSQFASEQVKEEIRKSKIIQNHPESKPIVQDLEDLDYCRGRITYALNFSCSNDNPPESPDKIDLQRLKNINEVIKANYCNGITANLRRALLTIEDGQFYKYWHSWLYVVESTKYCLIASDKEFRNFPYDHPSFVHYLDGLSSQLIEAPLHEIIDNFTPNEKTPDWMTTLIKDKELIKISQSGYIACKDGENFCHLIPGSRVANSPAGLAKLVRVPTNSSKQGS